MDKDITILAIERSCDETSAAIVKNGREVLSNVIIQSYGTHYVIEGSEEKIIEKIGCPDGTTIVIRDIFYNVPVRLKFLKKDVTDGYAVSGVVSKLSL